MGQNGGARPGAGRKKKFTTILREIEIEQAHGEAKKSLDFCIQMRDNEEAAEAIRIEASKVVMDRIWGKPKQAVDVNGSIGLNVTDVVKAAELARGATDNA